jgi:hypothetical protein
MYYPSHWITIPGLWRLSPGVLRMRLFLHTPPAYSLRRMRLSCITDNLGSVLADDIPSTPKLWEWSETAQEKVDGHSKVMHNLCW